MPKTFDYTDPAESTVFVGEEDGNEAIIELMQSYAKKREKNYKEAEAHIVEAKRILEELWARIQGEQYQYQTPPGEGMFKRMDVLGGAMRDDTINRDQWS